MAIKAEISFKVFEGGKRITAVRRTTMQNSWQDIQTAVFSFIRQEYPELRESDVTYTDLNIAQGYAYIKAINNDRTFQLIADKI